MARETRATRGTGADADRLRAGARSPAGAGPARSRRTEAVGGGAPGRTIRAVGDRAGDDAADAAEDAGEGRSRRIFVGRRGDDADDAGDAASRLAR